MLKKKKKKKRHRRTRPAVHYFKQIYFRYSNKFDKAYLIYKRVFCCWQKACFRVFSLFSACFETKQIKAHLDGTIG
jgi:hypothetical protein